MCYELVASDKRFVGLISVRAYNAIYVHGLLILVIYYSAYISLVPSLLY
jgi:hypothetical protein